MAMHEVRPDPDAVRVPIGVPLPGVELRVLDEQRAPVPDGEPGILYIGGVCLANGYRGDAALTATESLALAMAAVAAAITLGVQIPNGD